MSATYRTLALTFTDRAFRRTHGRGPSGTALSRWAFQLTRGADVLPGSLFGDIFWADGTLAEAKKSARAHFAGLGWCVAILP